MDIGENIKLYRKMKGLTQVELGEKIDVTGATVTRYEKGQLNPSIDKIIKIAETLDVPITKLTGLESIFYKDMYSRHILIYNLLNSYKNNLMNNLFKLLESLNGDNVEIPLINLENKYAIAIDEASTKTLRKLFNRINFDIFDIIGSTIYKNIRSKSIECITQNLIQNEIQNSLDIIYDKLTEFTRETLLSNAGFEFVIQLEEKNSLEVDSNELYYNIYNINAELSNDITASLKPLVIHELFSDLSFKILEDNYFDLNKDGKSRAYEYISDLTEQQKYRKATPNQ